jgi:hypothetical protein
MPMSTRGFDRSASLFAFAGLMCAAYVLCTSPPLLRADSITLNSGRVLTGNIVTGNVVTGNVVAGGGSQTVSLRTSAGLLVVFDRQEVQSIKRAGTPPTNNLANQPGKKPVRQARAKSQLTREQQAWMAKVRSLVDRAYGTQSQQRRRATTELLKIEDENALPALERYLANSPDAQAREFFAKVLRGMPGTKALYRLVYQSLTDRSPAVREAARKAIGPERSDQARSLYRQALKMGNINLVSLAARGIAEIGDPKGETVPYLIEALFYENGRLVGADTPHRDIDLYRIEGIKFENVVNDPWQAYLDEMAQGAAARAAINASPRGHIMTTQDMTNTILQEPAINAITPPMFGARNQQVRFGDFTETAQVHLGNIYNTPLRYTVKGISVNNVNQAVYDTLVQLTGQKLGTNKSNWRRWWASQLKNRAAKQPNPKPGDGSTDRVISKSSTAPENHD